MENIDDEILEKLREIARSTGWMFDTVLSDYTAYVRHKKLPLIRQVRELIMEEIEKHQP